MNKPTNAEFISSLRELADFYEARPELLAPFNPGFTVLPDGKEGLARVARLFGSCEKEVDDSFFRLKKTIGCIEVHAIEYRHAVCERVTVGKRLVPGTVVPARAEQYIPEHEEEVFEYRCPDSLLAET